MANNDYKQHISIAERNKWDKVVVDFAAHLGAGGVENHMLGNGTIPGFSMCDFTVARRDKLAGIEDGALNNPHPATHPWDMITGLSVVSHTGQFSDLLNIPSTCYVAEKGNCDTVGGIRITIGPSAPANPKNNKEIWINTSNIGIYTFISNTWNLLHAGWN